MKDIYIGAGVALAVVLFAGVSSFVLRENRVSSASAEAPAEMAGAFTRELRGKVIAEMGHPIEGFEPSMFMRVYPGLIEPDFDDVDALIGGYVYAGTLVYDPKGERELHTAARAVSDAGMKQLLENVGHRLGIDFEDADALEKVLLSISSSS